MGDIQKHSLSPSLRQVHVYYISEDYTYNDHRAICIEIKDESSFKKRSRILPG